MVKFYTDYDNFLFKVNARYNTVSQRAFNINIIYLAQLVRKGYEYMNKEASGGTPGVLFTHGSYWRELRRFLLRNLRDFGFGKTSMEDLFQDEIAKLCQQLSKKCGEPLDLSGTMNISVVNALWSILVKGFP